MARSVPQLFSSEAPIPQDFQEIAAALREAKPNLCFVDFAKESERQLSLLPELLKLDPRLVIIALLSASDPSLVLRCLRQGASDFILSPYDAELVDATMKKVSKLLPGDKVLKRAASVYCVMPAKGACGATTVACNLAHQLKRHGSKRILLADLDPLTGTLSFVLKIKSQYSFMDVLQRSSDIDADLWNAMVTNHYGVDVLLSPETAIEGADELTDASSILEYARYNYDVIVLDAESVYGPWNLALATLSDEVLLITTNELSALQAVQRALTYLENNGVGRWKIRVIVNRYQRDVGLGEEVIGTALNTDVYHVLPSDYESVQKALMEGKSIPPSSSLGKSLAKLADRMGGREESARKSPSFAGLLSLFSRTSS